MHSMFFYMQHLQSYLGDKYGVALAITALVIELFLVLYGEKKQPEGLWIYVGIQWLCLVLPIAFLFSHVLHMNEVQAQLLYHFLPAGLIGAVALTVWYEKAASRFGKKAMALFLIGLIFLIGNPWNYSLEHFQSNKLDPEVRDVSYMIMGDGTAVVPEPVGRQLHKVQQVTQLTYRDGYWYEFDEEMKYDIVPIFVYIKEHPVRYVVLPNRDYNQSYMDLVGYTLLGQTEHYAIYINPNY